MQTTCTRLHAKFADCPDARPVAALDARGQDVSNAIEVLVLLVARPNTSSSSSDGRTPAAQRGRRRALQAVERPVLVGAELVGQPVLDALGLQGTRR